MKILRSEVKIKNGGGFYDLFDDSIKSLFNITDEEYDFICETATDEELDIFLLALYDTPFSEKRKSIQMRNKLLENFNKK
jgi:hypothetical protein